jgi:peptidyl-prolyl cis-trans isomerase C/peptidyl-prolyl cis-trans isomerase D
MLMLCAGAAGASAQTAASGADVLATVGNRSITVREFNEKYDEVVKNTINAPTRELFLEDLIRYEVGVQEAEKRKMENDPIVRERFRQEMYKGLIERELGKQIAEIRVTDQEMRAWYTKNPEVRTSHILIEFRADATAEQKKAARDRAEEILKEVLASKRPFEELVNIYTDDVLSKRTGGDVGWQSSVTLVPAYYQTALRLKVNETARQLVETQFGFHIIRLTGRRSYEDANKRQIRAAVFDEKRKQLFDQFFDRLKKQTTIRVNRDRLPK